MTIFSWMLNTACCLVVRFGLEYGLRLDSVSGWFCGYARVFILLTVVIVTLLSHSACHLIVAISPHSTCCVTLRHVTTRQARRVVRDVTWSDVLCRVMRAYCSNMADDEEAVVLVCETITCFIAIYYFSSQVKLILLLKQMSSNSSSASFTE